MDNFILVQGGCSTMFGQQKRRQFVAQLSGYQVIRKYKVVQIWPGQTVTCLHTNSPGHIWTTLY
jgi:hypothetical protein